MNRIPRLTQYLVYKTAALKDRFELLAKKYPRVSLEMINWLSTVDPTGQRGKYLEWLVRQESLMNQEGDSWERLWDQLALKNLLAKIDRIRTIPKLAEKLGLKDGVGKWDYRMLSNWDMSYRNIDIDDEIFALRHDPNNALKIIYNQPPYRVVQVGGPGISPAVARNALCGLGSDTSWCTRHPETAEKYLENSKKIYVIFKNNYKYAQTDGDSEFNDRENEPIYYQEDSEIWDLLLRLGIAPLKSDQFEELVLDYARKENPPPDHLKTVLCQDSDFLEEIFGRFYRRGLKEGSPLEVDSWRTWLINSITENTVVLQGNNYNRLLDKYIIQVKRQPLESNFEHLLIREANPNYLLNYWSLKNRLLGRKGFGNLLPWPDAEKKLIGNLKVWEQYQRWVSPSGE
jgi:hypothetical protein